MSNQLVIPNNAECPQCDTKAHNGESVMNLFGIRFMNGEVIAQSHCKKCRKLVLKGAIKDKYNSFKASLNEKYHKQFEKINEQQGIKIDAIREKAKLEGEKIQQESKLRKQELREKESQELTDYKKSLLESVKN